jgi:hypothetical protein
MSPGHVTVIRWFTGQSHRSLKRMASGLVPRWVVMTLLARARPSINSKSRLWSASRPALAEKATRHGGAGVACAPRGSSAGRSLRGPRADGARFVDSFLGLRLLVGRQDRLERVSMKGARSCGRQGNRLRSRFRKRR